jgi:hypothetical protein
MAVRSYHFGQEKAHTSSGAFSCQARSRQERPHSFVPDKERQERRHSFVPDKSNPQKKQGATFTPDNQGF